MAAQRHPITGARLPIYWTPPERLPLPLPAPLEPDPDEIPTVRIRAPKRR